MSLPTRNSASLAPTFFSGGPQNRPHASDVWMPVTFEAPLLTSMPGLMRWTNGSRLPSGCNLTNASSTMRSFCVSRPVVSKSRKTSGRDNWTSIRRPSIADRGTDPDRDRRDNGAGERDDRRCLSTTLTAGHRGKPGMMWHSEAALPRGKSGGRESGTGGMRLPLGRGVGARRSRRTLWRTVKSFALCYPNRLLT